MPLRSRHGSSIGATRSTSARRPKKPDLGQTDGRNEASRNNQGGTSLVEVGDTVKVRASGRRVRIVAVLSHDRFEVEYLPDRMDDPIDRDTVQSEGEGGIYDGVDLTPMD